MGVDADGELPGRVYRLAAVTGLAIDGYGYRLFSAFMFQHLTLSILVPPLLVLGAPGRLLLRSTPTVASDVTS